MPRRPRSADSANVFHVINRSARKHPIFARPPDYRAYLRILAEGLDRHPVDLLAYCVMPNHWHLIVGPTEPHQLSRLLHWVTTTHAVRWRHRRRTVGEGPVYQGRFRSGTLPEPDDVMRACRYVERNPLRARLVERAEAWPWSSLCERLHGHMGIPLATAPFLLSEAWIDHVNAAMTLAERQSTPVPGRPESVENKPVPPMPAADRPGQQRRSHQQTRRRRDRLQRVTR